MAPAILAFLSLIATNDMAQAIALYVALNLILLALVSFLHRNA